MEDDDIARLDTVGAAIKTHTHTRSQITDFPTAMPADGGNADTVDGYHASEFWARIAARVVPSDYTGGQHPKKSAVQRRDQAG